MFTLMNLSDSSPSTINSDSTVFDLPTVALPIPSYTNDNSAELPPISQQQQINPPPHLLIREVVETIFLTLIIFWLVNTATGRFRIDGDSMEPTMHNNQYLLVNKLAYFFNEPERGDIIVLNYPNDPTKDYIKRIIALPGDFVDIRDQQVRINGTLINEPYISAPPTYAGSWTVPHDQFFVLGDNRNNSSDSHLWGFLPRYEIVGKSWFVYWPFNQVGRVPHHPHTVNDPSVAGTP